MVQTIRKRGNRLIYCLRLTFGLTLILPATLMAQNNFTASGIVIDEKGEPIIGVSISVKETSKGTITDVKGKFSIQTDPKSIVTFSYIGYLKKTVLASTLKNATITMEENEKALDEVVVVGYGVQKKKEATGATYNVKGEDMEKISASDLGTAIQGRIAGVNVQASSGAPGDEANILIRGVSSIQGTNSPLYIVDGIPYDSDPKLNPSEIESIDVLKDAASAAVYGSRGANGVILITTKQGKAGEMKISVTSYYGIQKITSKLNLLSTNDFMYVQSLRALSSGQAANKDNVYSMVQNNPSLLLNNTDWMKELTVDNAPTQNHTIQLSAGTKDLTYNFTLGYLSQAGSLINSGYDRFNSRANVNYTKGKWNIQTNLTFSTDTKQNASSTIISRAISMAPWIQSLNTRTQTTVLDAISTQEGISIGNQLNTFKAKDVTKTDNFTGNMKIAYNFTPNLSFSTMGGATFNNGRRVQTAPLFVIINPATGVTTPGQPISSMNYISTHNTSLINENVLNYKFDINKDHTFNFTGLFSLQQTTTDMFNAYRSTLISNDLTTLDATTGTPAVGGSATARDIVSFMGRIQYNYKSRYLFSASVREDGSSRFAPANRWGIFPSLMGGWNVAEEKFWKSLVGTVNTFKLRVSYGETGSQNFGDYLFVPLLTSNLDYGIGTDAADALLVGASQSAFTNLNVKWETSITRNFGVDLGLFNNALTLTADYYLTDKKDMLFPVTVPYSGGVGKSTVTMNVGDMTNNGVELAITYKYKHKDFSMSISANASANRNVVTKAPAELYLSSGAPVSGNDYLTMVKEGYPVGAFFMIPTSGIIKTADQLAVYKTATGKTTAALGDLIYQDTNGDGQITDADRVYYGSGAPLFDYGLNLIFNYKDFDLSMLWYASVGNKIVNGTKISSYMQQNNRDVIYQWSPVNPNSDIPAFRTTTHDNLRAYADIWLEDGSYIRLREISLGYSLSKKITSLLKLNKFRIYVSGQNPLTITKYKGFDPEVGGDGTGSRGVDKANYPVTSQYKVGLQLNF